MSKTLRSLFICFLAVHATLLHAQEFSIGLKGGGNKTYGGIITGDDAEIPIEYTSDTFTAEGEIGIHGGIWTQIYLGKFFIRPEIVFSMLKSRFDFPQGPRLYEVEELSIPVLVGYNIYGPVDIYAGLAYKNILDATLEGNEPIADTPQIVVQDTPLSAQIGAKVEFGNFGLDVRYDQSLSTKKSQDVNILSNWYRNSDPVMDRGVMEDARLHQIIVSLTVKLFHSKNAGKRQRRGGKCSY